MNDTGFSRKPAIFPITISTPFGVLRLAYQLDTLPDAEGACNGSVRVLDASPRLKTDEGLAFLVMLPDVLHAAGNLSVLHCLSASMPSKASVSVQS